ncbi:pro-sigmaK processing inhibitor BofA family protein [Paenibacillus methanolicus]|uniref:Inhibitor of the pro-sigma K processing machinery n=1 Tax=Paenibacillus methanolicus TaxID=582686 RepID=A0A5S5BR35_9BACL|nr:pro-sigmaK processing inhibitor BofA family protein [Paenibacillus methanolicus]TYP69457.1 inhibitor of the pro-sigma K processing machinery [Paenibacillus methanolicus]
MKSVWLAILIGSTVLLLVVLLRQKLSWGWLKRFGLHLVTAALALYALNYSGLLQGFEIPLTPATISTVVLLGIPGIGLILGLQYIVL